MTDECCGECGKYATCLEVALFLLSDLECCAWEEAAGDLTRYSELMNDLADWLNERGGAL